MAQEFGELLIKSGITKNYHMLFMYYLLLMGNFTGSTIVIDSYQPRNPASNTGGYTITNNGNNPVFAYGATRVRLE